MIGNDRAVIIVNPVAGSFSEKKINEVTRLFKNKFKKVDVFYTKEKGDGKNIVEKQMEKGPDVIVAAGGDGTLNEVLNGMVYSDIPLGFIPLGTANVLANEFSLPVDSRAAAKKILDSRPKYVSTGLINGRHFIMAAGIGFDGEAVYRVNPTLKKIVGKLAYLVSGFDALWKFHPEKLAISVDDTLYTGYGLIVCNSKYYGGSFKVCPDASVQSSELSLCIMHGETRIDLVRSLIHILAGKHLLLKQVTITEGKKISVSGHARIQIDGDYFGTPPAVIKIQPDALKFCV